jgi:hypothetical protein
MRLAASQLENVADRRLSVLLVFGLLYFERLCLHRLAIIVRGKLHRVWYVATAFSISHTELHRTCPLMTQSGFKKTRLAGSRVKVIREERWKPNIVAVESLITFP